MGVTLATFAACCWLEASPGDFPRWRVGGCTEAWTPSQKVRTPVALLTFFLTPPHPQTAVTCPPWSWYPHGCWVGGPRNFMEESRSQRKELEAERKARAQGRIQTFSQASKILPFFPLFLSPFTHVFECPAQPVGSPSAVCPVPCWALTPPPPPPRPPTASRAEFTERRE